MTSGAGTILTSCYHDDGKVDAVLHEIDVNLKGVFLGMKYQIGAMLRTGGGRS